MKNPNRRWSDTGPAPFVGWLDGVVMKPSQIQIHKCKYTNTKKKQYKYRQWSDTTPGRFVGWLAGGGESLPATASITHHGHQPPMLWSSWSSLSWSPSPSWPSCPPWPSWSPSSWYQSWPLSLASGTNHQCCDDHDGHDHLDHHDNLDQHHHPKSATFMKVDNCFFFCHWYDSSLSLFPFFYIIDFPSVNPAHPL